MGLDMYLERANIKEYETNRDDYKIYEEVGYWRKANMIHHWFVENVQDGFDECQKSIVSQEQLENLLEICELVLKKVKFKKGKILILETNASIEDVKKISIYQNNIKYYF